VDPETLKRQVMALEAALRSIQAEMDRRMTDVEELAHYPVQRKPAPEYADDPFKLQFFPEIDVSISGVPQVRVWQGYHLTPYGRAAWPSSGDSELVPITGSGWIITRQAKSGPGSVTVVFQATGCNPASTTNYESDVCRVSYAGGQIYLHELSPGARNFVATL